MECGSGPQRMVIACADSTCRHSNSRLIPYGNPRMKKTQTKLIEAAEREFAENGFHGASIRNITARAGANIAAVNYHFGSKESLFVEMIRYRVTPINERRIELLNRAVTAAGETPLGIRELVEIIIRPLVESLAAASKPNAQRYFLRALGRGMSEEASLKKPLYEDILAEVTKRFQIEMQRCLSDLPEEAAKVSFVYLRSTMMGVMQLQTDSSTLPSGIRFPDADSMIAFVSGGIEAMAQEFRTKLN